jgi:Ca-activated chloride channel family protein
MQPIIRIDRNIVAEQVDDVIHVMIDIQAPDATPAERAPIDVVLVIDRSGSMSGAPLRAVLEAVANVLHKVGPQDRVAVVAFDDDVTLVLPLAHHHDRTAAAQLVRQIRSGGSTNLSGGWLKALELLDASPRPEAVRRAVVLTDGHANAGMRSIDALGPVVRAGRDRGIITTCIGFGDGYDQHFLAGIADCGGGDDFFCEGADQANAVFANQLDILAGVVAQNISVEFRPTDVVAAQAVLNEYPVAQVEGGLQAHLGDAVGGELRRVVAKFHLRPAASRGLTDTHIADVVIRWASTVGEIALHTVTVPVRLDTTARQVVVDEGVREEVVRLEVARGRRLALEAEERGQRAEAANLLRRAAESARGYASMANDVARLEADAVSVEHDGFTDMDRKRMYSTSRGTMKGRTKTFASEHFPAPDPDDIVRRTPPVSNPGDPGATSDPSNPS